MKMKEETKMCEKRISDYKKAVDVIKDIPQFHLGEQVQTEDREGIIVKIEMPFNGLYIEPEKSKAVIWFGTESVNGFISKEYRLKELIKI